MQDNENKQAHEKIDESEIFKKPNSRLVSLVGGGIVGLSAGMVTERVFNVYDKVNDYSLAAGTVTAIVVALPLAVRLNRGPKDLHD